MTNTQDGPPIVEDWCGPCPICNGKTFARHRIAATRAQPQPDAAMVEALRNIAEWSDSAMQHPSCAIDMRNTARAALTAIGGGDDPAAGAGEGG